MKNIDAAKIPVALRECKQWVLWKIIDRDGQPTKVPFQSNGRPAKSNTPDTWADFASIWEAFQRGGYAGIGFMFSADDEFCGVDLDGCRNPETGEVAQWAREIIKELDTYAEVSPSKTGVKLFALGSNPFGAGRKKEITDAPRVCDKTPAIEVYDQLRYFAVTGWRLAGRQDLQVRETELAAIGRRYWPEPAHPAAASNVSASSVADRARKYLAKLPPAISGSGGHNATFHAACVLVLGFELGESDALSLLREYNATCNPPWSERELQHKVTQAMKQPGERGYLKNASPETWQAVKIPAYKDHPQAKPEPRLTTLAAAAQSFVDTIREGKTTLVTTGIGELDYALGGGVEPGELVILAARPSHGKSAVALQCAHVWTYLGMPCLIVSEEMSALALGKRAVQYIANVPQEHWGHRLEELDKAVAEYSEHHAVTVIAESCGTVEAAVEQIDKAVKQHKIQAAIVDYAQILRGHGKSRYEQVTHTSIALKQAAARHQIILLMLCQLGRDIEKRPKFTPVMSDIKETGQLEQDADVIVFLVWPNKIDQSQPIEDYMFFVAKNRNRAINQGAVKCRFVPSRQMVLESKASERAESSSNFSRKLADWNNRD